MARWGPRVENIWMVEGDGFWTFRALTPDPTFSMDPQALWDHQIEYVDDVDAVALGFSDRTVRVAYGDLKPAAKMFSPQ